MSLGGSLSGVSFSGLSSGIDSDSIISRLMQIEAIPIQRLQNQQGQIQGRLEIMSQFKSRLTALSVAGGALNSASAYNAITAKSSDDKIATVSGTNDAIAGVYELEVSKLAQTHKISSTAQQDTSTALNLSGTMVINGRAIKIETGDSLKAIATKINGANANVTASLIDGGTGNSYLTLSSKSSGKANAVQIGDLSGTVANTLGLANGALALRETIVGGATSYGFTSSTTNLSQLMGTSGVGSKSFTINGTAVNVDLDTTSLQGVATAINTAGTGATATVRSVTENGATKYKLDITGLTSQADAGGVLQSLGVLQAGYGSEIVEAQDAEYSLDGLDFTSATNSITTVIPGATITLLKANDTTPEKATLSLTQDTEAVKNKVKELATAYNSMMDFIKQNSQFDKDTFAAGPLFGDSTVRQVEASLSTMLFNTVSGLNGTYTNIAQVGFSFDSDGKLAVDDAALDKAVKENPTAVGALFRSMGTATSSSISYISSTSKTKASGSSGYAIDVTQLATQSTLTGDIAQSSVLTSTETLTFNGKLFGDAAYSFIIDPGMSQSAIVDKINSDAKLKDLVTASVDGGKLKLTSKKYGANSAFTVVSDKAAAADTSGIGTAPATFTTGVDIAGTINGEAATGSGQLLMGNAGNANTDGLQVLYTGNTTGAIGNLNYSKGMGSQVNDMVGLFTDAVNGLLTANDKSMQTQIETITKSIEDLQTRLGDKQVQLKQKFARMEQAIAQLQSQQARIQSIAR